MCALIGNLIGKRWSCLQHHSPSMPVLGREGWCISVKWFLVLELCHPTIPSCLTQTLPRNGSFAQSTHSSSVWGLLQTAQLWNTHTPSHLLLSTAPMLSICSAGTIFGTVQLVLVHHIRSMLGVTLCRCDCVWDSYMCINIHMYVCRTYVCMCGEGDSIWNIPVWPPTCIGIPRMGVLFKHQCMHT